MQGLLTCCTKIMSRNVHDDAKCALSDGGSSELKTTNMYISIEITSIVSQP